MASTPRGALKRLRRPGALRSFTARMAERALGAVLRSPLADLARSRRHGPRNRRVVALTFDDGPVNGGTERMLETLARLSVRATFFCVGVNAERHPELIRRILAEGHVIAAHSMWHERTDALPLTGGAHIDQCREVLGRITGGVPALYRAPWGWLTPWEVLRLRQRGLTIIGWDIYSGDANEPPPTADAMLARVLARMRPGSIVLCHDGYPGADTYDRPATLALIEALVPALRARGYAFASIPDLLGIPADQAT